MFLKRISYGGAPKKGDLGLGKNIKRMLLFIPRGSLALIVHSLLMVLFFHSLPIVIAPLLFPYIIPL